MTNKTGWNAPRPTRLKTSPKALRNPLLKARPRGQWYPDLVGVVRRYPATLEAWQARQESGRRNMAKLQAEGRATRKGVPDGYSGRREEVAEFKAACAAEAKEIVQLMVDKNILSPDDEKANEAIEYAVAVVRDPTIEHRMRLVAAKTVLDFTKAKPASTTKVELAKAEDFLAALASEIK